MAQKKRNLLRFEVHVTDHCNLNCRSCSHFSPLAQEYYLDINQFQNDCKRLSLLTNGNLEDIVFLGGEPLLHPNLSDIFEIARKIFKNTGFSVVTNGILLLKQAKSFWESCQQNNVQIYVSCYPINLDIKAIKDIAKPYGVKIMCAYSNGMIKEKGLKWSYMKLDITGSRDIEKNFKICGQSNSCINLRNGRLYTCPTITYIEDLNKYFNQKFEVTCQDYIDIYIYRADSIGQILDFLSKAPSFCRYCNIEQCNQIQWGYSKKELFEWVSS